MKPTEYTQAQIDLAFCMGLIRGLSMLDDGPDKDVLLKLLHKLESVSVLLNKYMGGK